MNATYTVRKINMGEEYEYRDGKRMVRLGGTTWAVTNQAGQVYEFYQAKYIAQHAADFKAAKEAGKVTEFYKTLSAKGNPANSRYSK